MGNKYYNYKEVNDWGDGSYLSGNTDFDFQRFIHSEGGKYVIKARGFMTRYSDVDDPELLKYWEDMGVRCEIRVTEGEKWLAFVPLEAYENKEMNLPVVAIFRPVELLAIAFYEYMIDLAAQGEFIALIYSSEDLNTNDLFYDMIQETLRDFPIDPSRVYVTGHSHYGEFAMEFMRRHHKSIAAVGQQGDTAGIILDFYGSTQEGVELMTSIDMPVINVAGTTEMVGIFPMNTDAPGVPEDSPLRKRPFPMNRDDRIASWKRRLYAMRCPIPSDEEIIAAANGNKVERVLGFPVDRADIVYAEGSECYIGDIKNIDGNFRFRTVAMENIPHTTSRFMHVLTWSFLRRFARDLKTGEVIELY